jgi:hypothetical protein
MKESVLRKHFKIYPLVMIVILLAKIVLEQNLISASNVTEINYIFTKILVLMKVSVLFLLSG